AADAGRGQRGRGRPRGGARGRTRAGVARRPSGAQTRLRPGSHAQPGGMRRRMRWLAVALGLVILAGCGYRFAGTGPNVPTTARTISIPLFANRTREKGLDVELQRALEEEFRRRGLLTVVRDRDSDLVLSGTIRRFTTVPVAFSATGEAVEDRGFRRGA